MRKKKNLALPILLALLLLSLGGYAVGKYTTTIQKKHTVSFDAKLATSMTVTGPEKVTLIPGKDIELTYTVTIENMEKLPCTLTVTFENASDEAAKSSEHKRYMDFAGGSGFTVSTDGKICTYEKQITGTGATVTETITVPMKVSQYIKSDAHADLTVTAKLTENH